MTFTSDSGSKVVTESGLNFFHVSHSTGTGSTSSFSFSRPVVLADLGRSFLLDVVIGSTSGSAQSVRLVVSFTK